MRVDNQTRYSTEDLKALFAECLRRMQQEGFPNGKSSLRSAGLSVSVSYTTSTVHFMTSVSVPGARHVDLRIGRPERFFATPNLDCAPRAIAAEFIFHLGKIAASSGKAPASILKGFEQFNVRYLPAPTRGTGEWLRERVRDATNGKRVVAAEKDVARCQKNLRKAQTRAKLANTLLKNRQKDLKQATRRLEREKQKTAEIAALQMILLPHEEITGDDASAGKETNG